MNIRSLPEDHDSLPLLEFLEAEWQREWEGEADKDEADRRNNGAETPSGIAGDVQAAKPLPCALLV